MATDYDVMIFARDRGINRVVHFTRVESFERIISDGEIKSTTQVPGKYRNDKKRLDKHLDYICCSITYPNAWLLKQYRDRHGHSTWIILVLEKNVLWRDTNMFSPVNAAAKDAGSVIQGGVKGIEALFADRVGKWRRYSGHRPDCPTDMQAEVLVKDAISISHVRKVFVQSRRNVEEIEGMLEEWPNDRPDVAVWDTWFNPYELSDMIWHNRR